MAAVQEGVMSDYVVVAAGSAGSVVFRRLLDAGHSVHPIEAGPVDADPAIHTPQGWPGLLGGAVTTVRGAVAGIDHRNTASAVVSLRDGAIAIGHRPIEDFNTEQMVGVGYNQTTTRGGERMSAWTSFVAPVLQSSESDGQHQRAGASGCRGDGSCGWRGVLP